MSLYYSPNTYILQQQTYFYQTRNHYIEKYHSYEKLKKATHPLVHSLDLDFIDKNTQMAWEQEFYDSIHSKIKKYFPKSYHNLQKLREIIYTRDFIWFYVCEHECITTEDIIQHPTLQWYMSEFSGNPNVKIQDVINHPELEWDTSILSLNPNMTMEIITQNPQIQWDPDFVSLNINITIDVVKQYPDYPWVYESLLHNRNMTLDIIKENPDILPLDYYFISTNMSITATDIIENLDEAWDWDALMVHPSMNWDVIEACTRKMNAKYKNMKQDPFAKFLIKRGYYNHESLIKTLVRHMITREKEVYVKTKIQRVYTIYLRKICDKYNTPYDVIEHILCK